MNQPSMRRRGYLFADALIALALLVTVAVALLSSLSAYQRFDRRLAEQRRLDRLAESALVDLQRGQAPGDHAEVHRFEMPAPPGWQWARIEVRQGQQVGHITGLVRRAS